MTDKKIKVRQFKSLSDFVHNATEEEHIQILTLAAQEAVKEQQILEAAGKAEAIRLVADADAMALKTIGEQAATASGIKAVELTLAQQAIEAHKAIAAEGTVVLTDGNTGDNVSNTVAQAISVSSALKLND